MKERDASGGATARGPRSVATGVLAGAVTLLCVRPTHAGMPSLVLTDLTAMRVEILSFFLVLLAGSAWGLKAIWNSLAKDFPKLPRMTFKRAAAVTTLWVALFLLVLTMISGARELMTPGAWERHGYTYKLNDASDSVTYKRPTLESRRAKLETLKTALWAYREKHGVFPPDDRDPGVPAWAWEADELLRTKFVYLPDGGNVLAYEPPLVANGERWVLMRSGEVRRISLADLNLWVNVARRAATAPGTRPMEGGR